MFMLAATTITTIFCAKQLWIEKRCGKWLMTASSSRKKVNAMKNAGSTKKSRGFAKEKVEVLQWMRHDCKFLLRSLRTTYHDQEV